MVAVAETHVHMSSDANQCRMKLLIEPKLPSGIIYMFQIFVDEVVRDYFPELGYNLQDNCGSGERERMCVFG